MLEAWREHLRSGGPFPAHEDLAPPEAAAGEARAALHGDVIVDLTHRALIAVSGPDARTLLQGQLTNDIEAVDESRTQLSAWCSIKGRVLALFRIWQRGEALHLELPAELEESIAARLRMYVLRARVSIESASQDAVRFGVSGTEVAKLLAKEHGPLPARPDRALRSGECTFIRLRGERPRFQVIAPFDAARALWEQCREVATPVSVPAWNLLDIRAGIPNISAAQSDRFLPQALNLDRIDGLSFDKGCYAGQEIIARTQYLGRLKRHLCRAALHATEPPIPGDMILAGAGHRDEQAGQVVSAAASERAGRWELLAVINDAAVTGELRLEGSLGPALELLPLPCDAEPHAA